MSKSKRAKPPVPQRKHWLSNREFIALINTFGMVAVVAIKWGIVGYLGWCGFKSIEALAGQKTFADIAVNFIGNLTMNKWVGWASVLVFTSEGSPSPLSSAMHHS